MLRQGPKVPQCRAGRGNATQIAVQPKVLSLAHLLPLFTQFRVGAMQGTDLFGHACGAEKNAVCIDLEEYSLPGRCLRLCCRRARRKNSVAVQGVAVAAPRVAVPKAEKATRQLAVDSLEMQCGAGRSIHHKFFPENTVDQNTNSRLASHFGDLAALLCRFCKTCFQTCDTASKQGHVNGDFPKCRVP